MKAIYKKLFATAAVFGLAAAAHAQLYIATGSSGVTAWFNFSINPTLNQVTVQVDNTHLGVGGVTGTVTSFGFNVPASIVPSASSNATLVGAGPLLSTTGVTANTWRFFVPYGLNNFDQDVGAGSGVNYNGGQPSESVLFGTSATFVFQFADFTDASGFLGANGVSAKWQGLSTTGQSDEGFGNPGTPNAPPIVPVPEPSTYGLFGAASLLAGLILRRRFSKR